jgi:hypothetical protein
MTIKLEPGDLEACDAAMRLEQAQEHYAFARAYFMNKVSNVGDKEIEQEIQDKGLTAPRVTLAHIEEYIAWEGYFTGNHVNNYATGVVGPAYRPPEVLVALGCLTICVLVLKNGFTVTGESACVSPENFNEELGRKNARQKAVDKIWMLEGYLLKDHLYNARIFSSASGGGDFGDS